MKAESEKLQRGNAWEKSEERERESERGKTGRREVRTDWERDTAPRTSC